MRGENRRPGFLPLCAAEGARFGGLVGTRDAEPCHQEQDGEPMSGEAFCIHDLPEYTAHSTEGKRADGGLF
jgi:hypothetical protein